MVDEIMQAAPDPSTGRQYRRLWVPANISNESLKWGELGNEQIATALAAVSKLGVSWNGTPLAYIKIN